MGLAALAFTGTGSWHPSFWTDEAATLSAIRRDFPDLVSMLGSVDAVHGAYYFLMFGWSRIFGFSEMALRLPSVLAVAGAAFVVVELGKKLAGVQYGVVASVLFLLMPRTQYVATDGRSYALTVLGAVLATYVLVSTRKSPTKAKWVLYAAIGFVTVSLSFYCIFLLFAHVLTLLWDNRLRSQWRAMVLASVAWFVPAACIGFAASQQQFQIAWIRDVGPAFSFELIFLQFFSDGYFSIDSHVVPTPTTGEDFSMVALTIAFWLLATCCLLLFKRRFLVRLALPWLVVPVLAVVAGSLILGGNYYLPRYLTFELPAMALLAALPLVNGTRLLAQRIAVKPETLMVAAAVLLVSLSIPSYLGQRTQYGRDTQDDFRFVAASVEGLAAEGDCFVMNSDVDLVLQAYPQSFQGLSDPTIGLTAAEWKRIFNQRFDVASSAERIARCSTVLLIEKSHKSEMAAALMELGYTADAGESGASTTVTRYRASIRG